MIMCGPGHLTEPNLSNKAVEEAVTVDERARIWQKDRFDVHVNMVTVTFMPRMSSY